MRDPDNKQDTREYLYFWRDEGYKRSGTEEVRIYTPNKAKLEQIENTSKKWQYYTLLKGLRIRSAPWMKDITIEHRNGVSDWLEGAPSKGAEGNLHYEDEAKRQDIFNGSKHSSEPPPAWTKLISSSVKDLKHAQDKDDAYRAELDKEDENPMFSEPYNEKIFYLVAKAKVEFYSKNTIAERSKKGQVWRQCLKGAMTGWRRKLYKSKAEAEFNNNETAYMKAVAGLSNWWKIAEKVAINPAVKALEELNAPRWMILSERENSSSESEEEIIAKSRQVTEQPKENEIIIAGFGLPDEDMQKEYFDRKGIPWERAKKLWLGIQLANEAGEFAKKDRNDVYTPQEEIEAAKKAKKPDSLLSFEDIALNNALDEFNKGIITEEEYKRRIDAIKRIQTNTSKESKPEKKTIIVKKKK
jgi:hypothetical protein